MHVAIIFPMDVYVFKICDWILETVPNHTFLFQYIYHCNMKNIAFPIIFHSDYKEFNAQITERI